MRKFLAVLALLWVGSCPAFGTTYTGCQGYSKPVPGDPSVANTWGAILNTNFDLVDASVGGSLTLSVAGSSNVSLTSINGASDQARHAYFNFTGVLTGNINVFWPNGKCRTFVVKNNTSGAYTLTIAVSNGALTPAPAGNTYVVPQGETVALVSDGSSIYPANTPVGIGAAKSGANSDITSLSGITTPLSVSQGGTGNATGRPSGAAGGALAGTYPSPSLAPIATGTMLANTSGSSATPVAIPIPTFRTQAFTSSGSFTVPATSLEVIVTGAGGDYYSSAQGGNAGSTGIVYLSGLTVGSTISVTVGTASALNDGGASSITVNGTTYTAPGGARNSTSAATPTGFTINVPGGVSPYAGSGTGVGAASYWGGPGAYGSGGNSWAGPFRGINGIVVFRWVQ